MNTEPLEPICSEGHVQRKPQCESCARERRIAAGLRTLSELMDRWLRESVQAAEDEAPT